MDIDRTIAKLELKELLAKLLQSENVLKWAEAYMSKFLEYAEELLPADSRRICFWEKYPISNSMVLSSRHVASRVELKYGYAVVIDEVPDEVQEDDSNEDNRRVIYFKHEFFSMLKSAILDKRLYIPQIPLPQVDLMEMEILGRNVSFIQSENKTAFAKLIFDLIGLED